MDASLVAPLATLVAISVAARTVYFQLFYKYFRLSFADAPVWSLLYFSAFAVLVGFLFPAAVQTLFREVTVLGYLGLLFFLVVLCPALFHYVRGRDGNPTWLAMLFPEEGMLTLGERYILAKIGDVVFQQLVAGALVLTLAGAGVSYPATVGIFVVLFASAHFYIFLTSGLLWGLHYTMYATLGGFVFPFLFLFVPGGVAYAIVVHMLFYVLSGIFFANLPRPHPAVEQELTGKPA